MDLLQQVSLTCIVHRCNWCSCEAYRRLYVSGTNLLPQVPSEISQDYLCLNVFLLTSGMHVCFLLVGWITQLTKEPTLFLLGSEQCKYYYWVNTDWEGTHLSFSSSILRFSFWRGANIKHNFLKSTPPTSVLPSTTSRYFYLFS